MSGLGVSELEQRFNARAALRVPARRGGRARLTTRLGCRRAAKTRVWDFLQRAAINLKGDAPRTPRSYLGFCRSVYEVASNVTLGARDYDPVVGRWVSKDPIRFGGHQSNLYVYVNNDPVNRVDPSGLESPVDALLGPYFAAQDASSDAEQFFHQPFGGVDGPGDAYRHCVASCNITQRYGPELPAVLGWLHEHLPWDSDDDPAATAMDTNNNACGRGFGGDPDTDCSLRCLGAAKGGQLTTIP
ncbi:MAG: RHS repeat-associated core domain-containing protein [Polyangiaceae bacterium]